MPRRRLVGRLRPTISVTTWPVPGRIYRFGDVDPVLRRARHPTSCGRVRPGQGAKSVIGVQGVSGQSFGLRSLEATGELPCSRARGKERRQRLPRGLRARRQRQRPASFDIISPASTSTSGVIGVRPSASAVGTAAERATVVRARGRPERGWQSLHLLASEASDPQPGPAVGLMPGRWRRDNVGHRLARHLAGCTEDQPRPGLHLRPSGRNGLEHSCSIRMLSTADIRPTWLARRGDRIRSARSNFQSQGSAVLRLVVAGNLIACRSG